MGKHPTFEQRCNSAALCSAGLTHASITAQIGTTQSADTREFQRNADSGVYFCGPAQEAADRRSSAAGSRPRGIITELVAVIEAKLTQEGWNPPQISNWLALTKQLHGSH